jgi:LCP family protein required for cell wall assembly
MHGRRDESDNASTRQWPARPPRPSGERGAGQFSPRRLAGRTGYFVTCILAVLALVVAGFSYRVVNEVASIGRSNAIVSGPSIGAQNILLMGLESRTYWNGTILPPNILDKLHAGSEQAVADGTGGNDTNTLILIHIFAGGKKAIGFSIPRDDWVQFADTIGPQQVGKIDQAYGVSMFFREQQLVQKDPGMNQDQVASEGNEAGQAAAVATVEKLTGVHIDHFAAINLYGFYELAKVMGGVEVCLKHAVYDQNSGANFHAGYQHLDASQALAFVRQRDGLPNGDLDRTHRQQAFIDSVMHQLRTAGVLDDLTKVQALLSVASKYVITDAGWNLLEFSAQLRSLTSQNLVFHTLPITGYETIDGQDANAVNPAAIKQIVNATFYPPAAPAKPSRSAQEAAAQARATTVDVYNGAGVQGLAHKVSSELVSAGYRAGKIGNTSPRSSTEVLYGTGKDAAASAQRLATMFGVAASASASVPPGHVEILLGASTSVPSTLGSGQATGSGLSSDAATASASPSVAIPTTGPQGGAVVAKDGIPCVN